MRSTSERISGGRRLGQVTKRLLTRTETEWRALSGLLPARQLLRRSSDAWRDLVREELDRVRDVTVRETSDVALCDVPVVTEELVLEEDLVGDLRGTSDEQAVRRRNERVELGA